MPRRDALGIKDGLYGLARGVNASRGLPRPFHHPNRSRHRTRAVLRRRRGSAGFNAVEARHGRWLSQRQKLGIGGSRLGERNRLFHCAADRRGLQSIGGGASGPVIQRRPDREPLRLLRDVLMDGVVGEAGQRVAVCAKYGLDFHNA